MLLTWQPTNRRPADLASPGRACPAPQVVGVSFHVGSGCQNVGVYADAISAAREAFDMASGFGFAMELLDIGGGFTAPYDETTASLFYETAAVINRSLARWFPPNCGVRVIAEPGRWVGACRRLGLLCNLP